LMNAFAMTRLFECTETWNLWRKKERHKCVLIMTQRFECVVYGVGFYKQSSEEGSIKRLEWMVNCFFFYFPVLIPSTMPLCRWIGSVIFFRFGMFCLEGYEMRVICTLCNLMCTWGWIIVIIRPLTLLPRSCRNFF
jgi:hypothetical protein